MKDFFNRIFVNVAGSRPAKFRQRDRWILFALLAFQPIYTILKDILGVIHG